MPVETSFCIAMLTLWLMPMSSVRISSETAVGVWVCAETDVTAPNDIIAQITVTVRIRRISSGSRWRTVSNVLRARNMMLQGGTTRPPTPGHLIRLQRAVPRVLLFSCGAGTFRESTEFGEDPHEQLLTTLHVQLSIDAPQVGVHGMGRQPQARGGVLLGIAVEHRADDAALARREAETAGE